MLNFLNLPEVVSTFALVSVAVSEPGYYHHGYSHYGGYGHHGYYGKREAEPVYIDFDKYGINGHIYGY